MRWDELSVESEPQLAQARLPGYRDAATVRRFDAPEALDIRFYEVAARSVLNRVPAASRMPFRWTINPYRGCTHACVYCMAGDTPVLMADGRQRPLAELRPGDAIYGTAVVGFHRRYVRTTVLDHWESVRLAWRVTLQDGTELIASADHRFLTRRGFRFVGGSREGGPRRPRLEVGDSLAGSGRLALPPGGAPHRWGTTAPGDGPEYRRGYVCGLLRGEERYAAAAQDRTSSLAVVGAPTRARLATIDPAALARARGYLLQAGAHELQNGLVGAAGGGRVHAVQLAEARPDAAWISLLTRWPACAGLEWCRGFLAGLYDATGSRSAFALRIATATPQVERRAREALSLLDIDAACDRAADGATPGSLRLRGGLADQLRFLSLTDPAIAGKRRIEGEAVKSAAGLRVVAIEQLGLRMPMFDITTASGDFIANGVVSHNCFARPTHTYLDFDAGRDFEREIVVKVNAPEVLRAELGRPSWTHEHVAMGTNTDPYQWVESRYRLMPGIWEALRDSRTPCSVLTKSPLLLRDKDLLVDVARYTDVRACLSIPTLDTRAWRATEPHTPHPRARLEAVAELNRAGISTGVLVAPLMPGINDAPEQLGPLLEAIAEAGATSVAGIALHLRGEVKGLFMDWLKTHRPDLLERYRELYGRGAYAPAAERQRLSALVSDHRDGFASMGVRGVRPAAARFQRPFPRRPPPTAAPPVRASVQESLF